MKLEHLLELRDYDLETLRYKYNIEEADIEKDVSYMKLKNVTMVRKEKLLPGHFYYSGNSIKLIYLNDKVLLKALSTDEIIKKYGNGILLSSRPDKINNLYVYPEYGFAISKDKEDIEFMEIFLPTTIENYKLYIFKESLL